MKPWAKYSFDEKSGEWIPDREADIITHLKEQEKARIKEQEKARNEFWANKYRITYDKLWNTFVDVHDELLYKELTKGMNMNIAPTNVIKFTYENAKNDNTPIVLVTGVADDYVYGYNLNYLKDIAFEGCFRKYFRSYMDNVVNLTDQVIEVSKPKPKEKTLTLKDLNPGDHFEFLVCAGYNAKFVVTSFTPDKRSCTIVLYERGTHWMPAGHTWLSHFTSGEVKKV